MSGKQAESTSVKPLGGVSLERVGDGAPVPVVNSTEVSEAEGRTKVGLPAPLGESTLRQLGNNLTRPADDLNASSENGQPSCTATVATLGVAAVAGAGFATSVCYGQAGVTATPTLSACDTSRVHSTPASASLGEVGAESFTYATPRGSAGGTPDANGSGHTLRPAHGARGGAGPVPFALGAQHGPSQVQIQAGGPVRFPSPFAASTLAGPPYTRL
jgi:hypothetical protein